MAIKPERILYRRAIALLFLFSTLLALSSVSAGQAVPRYEVFGGFSYLRFDSPTIGYADYSNLTGWNLGATVNVTHSLGVALDVSGHYGSQMNAYNYMVGPQYSWRKEKYQLFAHGFIGKAQNTVNITEPIFNGNVVEATRNGFESVGRVYAGGGGFDWYLTPRFTIRVLQADFLDTQTFAATQHDIRVSTGLVFHFGQVGKRRTR